MFVGKRNQYRWTIIVVVTLLLNVALAVINSVTINKTATATCQESGSHIDAAQIAVFPSAEAIGFGVNCQSSYRDDDGRDKIKAAISGLSFFRFISSKVFIGNKHITSKCLPPSKDIVIEICRLRE